MEAGGSGCDLRNHDNSCTVSRTSVKGMLGFGAEVDGQSDPLDDPEEMVDGKSLKAIHKNGSDIRDPVFSSFS